MALGKTANQSLRPFLKRLGPTFDNFARRGTTLIHKPLGMLMGGFWIDYTDLGPDSRWIATFVSPLYVPSDHIWLGWGDRIPGPGPENRVTPPLRINGSDDLVGETVRIMVEDGLEALLPALELEGFYQYLLSWNYSGNRLKAPCYEAMAYTAALVGKAEDVEEHLFNCEMWLTMVPDPRGLSPWEEKCLQRVRLVRGLFRSEGVAAVVLQLIEWRNASVRHFEVEDIAIDSESWR